MMRALWIVLLTLLLSGCGYNTLQATDEQTKASLAELLNQYQRRSDLIPNLVSAVKGFAVQEQTILLGVTEARAKIGSIQTTPRLINDPQGFARFQAAQDELTLALSRLMVTVENYPQLKSDAHFSDMMVELEGTENRVTYARNRYINAVQEYNVTVRSFPSNLTAKMFGFSVKPSFAVLNEIDVAHAPAAEFSAPKTALPNAATPTIK